MLCLEDFILIHQLRDHVSRTSQLQTWNQPRKRTIDATDLGDIKFVKSEYGKKKSMEVPSNFSVLRQKKYRH